MSEEITALLEKLKALPVEQLQELTIGLLNSMDLEVLKNVLDGASEKIMELTQGGNMEGEQNSKGEMPMEGENNPEGELAANGQNEEMSAMLGYM